MLVNATQFANAASKIEVVVLGKLAEVRLAQNAKQFTGMIVMELGIVIDVNPE
jgi:hypothetical protein